MSHNGQHEGGQFSLQLCIDRVRQPYGSTPDDDTILEADSANFEIINSRPNFRRTSEAFDNSAVNEFSTSLIFRSGRYISHQSDWTTSTREDNNPRHPLYKCYDSRLRSCATWRQFQQFDTSDLAQAGFYNIGDVNAIVIRCFFCAIELVNPGHRDDPFIEHIKKSPSCGYLKLKLGEHGLFAYKVLNIIGQLFVFLKDLLLLSRVRCA
ncbi:hypothetical protein CHS0354_027715 [Potamilus streckersoni]|uniref:Uncharacterized protein n=1 Tax=Potamilus streckersoni TaxID=2493646 RepID=A0AAE0VF40_9BIVA|nr:hypothetical protein CHS0354_027715 [Potamilus streckersoni]